MTAATRYLLWAVALAVLGQVTVEGYDRKLPKADLQFGLNLLQKLSPPGASGHNTFISPSSVATVLAMVYAGAKGKSQQELFNVLGYGQAGLNSRDEVLSGYKDTLNDFHIWDSAVKTANAALIQKNFQILQSYEKDLMDSFGTQLQSVDFQNSPSKVTSEINEWVKSKTDGMIPKILSSDVDRKAVMVLLNAIYFNGTWQYAFQSSENRLLPFYNQGTHPHLVDTMKLEANLSHAVVPSLKSQVVVLPYSGHRYSMVILLPNERTGFSELKKALSVKELVDLPRKLELKEVKVRLPKFELNTEYDLVPVLKKLGLKSVFTRGADLSRISRRPNLHVSDVRHKAAVKVNEKGTVASAATVAGVQELSQIIGGTVEFYVNHPFIFYIYDGATDDVLFLGEVRKV
ncbi:unnamed protein product [Ixodes hexagonus]